MARIRYQEAIGLEVKGGRPPACPAPSKADLVKSYVKESRSAPDVAAALGCSKDAVHRALKKYGIEAKPKAKRSRLREYGIRTLKKGIREKGIREYVREIGIHENTLRHHLGG